MESRTIVCLTISLTLLVCGVHGNETIATTETDLLTESPTSIKDHTSPEQTAMFVTEIEEISTFTSTKYTSTPTATDVAFANNDTQGNSTDASSESPTTFISKATVSSCLSDPCLNGGECIQISADDYICNCTVGYLGPDCSQPSRCTTDKGQKICGTARCVDEGDSFRCVCPEGSYFDYRSRKCRDLDLCPIITCKSHEICENGKCACEPNYRMNNESICEPNFCDSVGCPTEGMLCKEEEDSDYSCSCPQGYAFNGTECVAAFCVFPEFNGCAQECTDVPDNVVNHTGPECRCANEEVFRLQVDGVTCEFVRNVSCVDKKCDGGMCWINGDNETCACPPGYVEVDGNCVDACSAGKLPKGFCPGDHCETLAGKGYKCKCEGKFVQADDEITCTVRKMCSKGEAGWSECQSRNSDCVEDWATEKGFSCKCSDGQMMDKDGTCQDACDLKEYRNECSKMRATCVNVKNEKPVCRCLPFFRADEYITTCNQPATSSFLTHLPIPYEFYQETIPNSPITSELDFDYDLLEMDITKSLSELFTSFSVANVLDCRNEQGYSICKVELQFEEDTPIRILSRLKMDGTCHKLPNSNENLCLIPPSLIVREDKMDAVSFQKTDPCDADVKALLCGSETICSSSPDTFNCTCREGFSVRFKTYPFIDSETFIESCEDIDECAESNPCPRSSKCTNTIGSYYCSCKPGYRKTDEPSITKHTECIKLCDPNPCVHGSCTKSGDHTFECRCDAGYTGTLCNLSDGNCKAARTQVVIVGAVLGGILLVTLIMFAVTVSRLRRKEYLDEPNHILFDATEMTERRAGAYNNAFQKE